MFPLLALWVIRSARETLPCACARGVPGRAAGGVRAGHARRTESGAQEVLGVG